MRFPPSTLEEVELRIKRRGLDWLTKAQRKLWETAYPEKAAALRAKHKALRKNWAAEQLRIDGEAAKKQVEAIKAKCSQEASSAASLYAQAMR